MRFYLLLAIASLGICPALQAQVLPDGTTATQVNGNAIAPSGTGTINGGNLYHSFDQFNVPQSGVTFNTGNSSVNGAEVSNIINRVTGGDPSAILGTIESRQAFPNANLYLLNPNGVVFGQNARLDIGGSFHVTTGTGLGFENGTFNVDKNSLSFPNGDPRTIRFEVSQPAGIINQGNLAVGNGQSITFTGGSVINTGALTAPSGDVALTSVTGNSLVELRSPQTVLGLQVTAGAVPSNWNGKITELPKLAELLTGKVPEASQVVVRADGSLALVAIPTPTDLAIGNGMTISSGKIDVSNNGAIGGNVGIFGVKVGLVNALIDASGLLGGGKVLIGGDLQGKGLAPNALRTFIDSNSTINVSATLRGNGGTAIVWADQTTRFLGNIVAKGGAQLGDGGFVEVSGKQNLDYRGEVNTFAPNGKIGTLLLDPTDINIIGGTGPFDFIAFTEVDQFADPNNGSNTFSALTINGSPNNVILQATNDINFLDQITMFNLGVGLTAQAGRDINVNFDISTNGGAINFTAGRDIIGTGTLSSALIFSTGSQAGDINLTAARNVSVNGIDASVGNFAIPPASGGNITVQAGGNIQTTGTFNLFGNTYAIATNAATTGNAGNISLISTGGNIDVSSGRVHAIAVTGNSGNINFTATGNIKTGAGSTPLAGVATYLSVGGTGGTSGTVTFTSSGGAIDTTLGDIDTGNAGNSNGGNLLIQAASNISVGNISSVASNTNNKGGNIGLISQAGTINSVGVLSTTGGDITLQASGNVNSSTVSTTGVSGSGAISLTSNNGTINTTGNIDSSSFSSNGNGNGGNITFNALNGSIITAGTNIESGSTNGNGGNITFSAPNGSINNKTASIAAISINGNGGNITFTAINSITTTSLNSFSSKGIGGNISLDPIGDIVFNSANTSGEIQGGSFSASSTGGNIRILGTVSSSFAACAGASICTASNSGGSGGSIFLRHGGLNPFVIGNSSINGSAGIITTGTSTLNLSKIIPTGTSIFTQGNITIAPSGEQAFILPPPTQTGIEVNPKIQKILEIKEVMNKEVDRYFKEGNIEKAFETLERAYVSELGVFLESSLNPPAISIDKAQDILSDVSRRSGSVSALIYPVILGDRVEVLVIPPKGVGKPFHRYTNNISRQEVTKLLIDYRTNLRDTASQDYLEQAQRLYDLVMRPIDQQLQALKIETVVFVMDSGLRVIPPAALHDGKQFLVERYASANIPSLRLTRLEERDRQNTRILAMGLTEARGGFSTLPAVEIEIRTIGTQVLTGATFLDQDFTVNNLQDQRGKLSYSIVHLGTHGRFLQDRAKESFIQFWDGQLRGDQIPRLRFDQPVIDMLTLSACETAVGNNLGISGLAVESGARSILASLWTVSDTGTAPLMISFYQAFPDALSKATALRQAQIDLLTGKVKIENNQIVGLGNIGAIALPKGTENVDIRHPFFWSSFILVGNWL